MSFLAARPHGILLSHCLVLFFVWLPFRPPSFFFLSSLLAPAPSCCPRGFSYDFDFDEDELNRLRSWLLTLMATQAKQAVKDAEAAEACAAPALVTFRLSSLLLPPKD